VQKERLEEERQQTPEQHQRLRRQGRYLKVIPSASSTTADNFNAQHNSTR